MVTTIPSNTNKLYLKIFICVDVILDNKTPISEIKCTHVDIIIYRILRTISIEQNVLNLKKNHFYNKNLPI